MLEPKKGRSATSYVLNEQEQEGNKWTTGHLIACKANEPPTIPLKPNNNGKAHTHARNESTQMK